MPSGVLLGYCSLAENTGCLCRLTDEKAHKHVGHFKSVCGMGGGDSLSSVYHLLWNTEHSRRPSFSRPEHRTPK